jgi:hypothetical protein
MSTESFYFVFGFMGGVIATRIIFALNDLLKKASEK